MCWKCDNPDATDADYVKRMESSIESHGYFIQGVEEDRWRPGFAYTVGLTQIGHPELVVTGMRDQVGMPFLSRVAHFVVDHDVHGLLPGDFDVWPGGLTTQTIEVAEPNAHLLMAQRMYGFDIRALQLVYADERGNWPWSLGFRGDQPVLGPRVDS